MQSRKTHCNKHIHNNNNMSYASPLKDTKKSLPVQERTKYHIHDYKLINDPVHGHIQYV
jgi:hypothetical protein